MIKVCNISKRYSTKKTYIQALNNINIEFKEGKINSILGPNGSGKTTLLKIMSGLLKPTKGDIYLNNYSIKNNNLDVLKNIGVLFEGNRNLYNNLTVIQNFEYFGYLKLMNPNVLKKAILESISKYNLDKWKTNRVADLSRGTQNRLALAIALINKPKVLLLDEPTIALDAASVNLIQNLLLDACHELGTTILITTHQLSVAENISDYIAILKDGELISFDSLSNLKDLFRYNRYIIQSNREPDINKLRKLKNITSVNCINKKQPFEYDLTFDKKITPQNILNYFEGTEVSLTSICKKEPSLEEILLKILKNNGN